MLTVLQRFYQFILPFICRYTIRSNPLIYDLTPEQNQPPVKPLARHTELPIEIWLDVFEFATFFHRDATIVSLNPSIARHAAPNALGTNTPSMAMRTKLSLVLVSKAWRDIAIRLLYRHLEIRSLARGNSILEVLKNSIIQQQQGEQSNPSESDLESMGRGYGQWTRHVEVYTFARGSHSVEFLQTIHDILKLCPRLLTFSGNWIHPLPTEFLNGISGILRSSLHTLHWSDSSPRSSPGLRNVAFFSSFQSLQTLDLRISFGNDISTTSRPILPLLRNLILSTSKGSLEPATILLMPSLRNLVLRAPAWSSENEILLKSFLQVHGASLRTIDLPIMTQGCEFDVDNVAPSRTAPQVPPHLFLAQDVCPNLEMFTFPVTSSVVLNSSHPSLRRIGLRGGNVGGLYPDKPSRIRDCLLAIDIHKFPELQLIQTVGFLVDAHTDTIIKDIFIWWVEHFEKMGVTFVDGEGVLWKYDDDDPVANPPYSTTSAGLESLDNGIMKDCE